MTRSVSRPLTILLALALAVTATITWSSRSEAAVPYPAASRIEGGSHVQVAVNVSRRLFPKGGAPAIVLARDNLFPDSLAATGFASVAGGPILFTATNVLSPATRNEIQRVMTSGRVHILGGPNAVSVEVEDQIKAMGYSVSRFRGSDRYQTAALIANALFTNDPAISQVVIARGRGNPDSTQGWVDAVSCGAWAAENGVPILLVDPVGTPNSLPASTEGVLKAHNVKVAHVCGGPSAVTEAQMAKLRKLVPNVWRYAGNNRTKTAIAASEGLWKVRDARAKTFLLVPGFGDRFGYGIAASQLSAKLDAPMLLVDAKSPEACLDGGLGFETTCWLQQRTGPASGLVAIGSTSIISDGVLAGQAKAAGLALDKNPPGRVADLAGDDKPGDAGTAVRLAFSPVKDPEGAAVSYDVYFRAPPEPEPEPTATETSTAEPTETAAPTEEPTQDPLTKANGTKATRVKLTETTVDDEPVVWLDIEMCDREIPVDENGAPTSEVPQSTCKDKAYEFIVIAKDSGGNQAAASDTVSAAPADDVPAAPAVAPAPEKAESGFTMLRWVASDAADAVGYVIERAPWSSASIPIVTSAQCGAYAEVQRIPSAATTSWLDNGTSAGSTYCYRYRIIDSTGNESANSPAAEQFVR